MKVRAQVVDWCERADLGGWCLLLSGVALIALTLLIPAALQVSALRRQSDAANQTLANLQTQQGNYQTFVAAVEQGDPLLLERLAWHELHLKPVGLRTLDDRTPAEPGQTVHFEQWLRGDDPSVSPAPSTIPNSQLVRLTTNPLPRIGMFALGGLLIACGLLSSLRS
jgi:hypothetical protein